MKWCLENIEFKYPQGLKSPVFRSLSGVVDRRQSLGIHGPNGSGKTTLLKLLLGLVEPTAGTITLAGKPLREIPLWQIGRHTGFLMQNPRRQLFAATAQEELLFPFELAGTLTPAVREKADCLLSGFSLNNRNVASFLLSRGEQQRLALAAILMHNPEYLILDEPTSSLDAHNREFLMKELASWHQSGKGMLIVSHDQALLDMLCDEQYCLEAGKERNIGV